MSSVTALECPVLEAGAKKEISEEWDRVKSDIRRLYFGEKRGLRGEKGIIESMKRRHGFYASESQYVRQLKKWGFRKQRDLNSRFLSTKYQRSTDLSPAYLPQQPSFDKQWAHNKPKEINSASSDLHILDVSAASLKTRVVSCSCTWARESIGRGAITTVNFGSFLDPALISSIRSTSNFDPLKPRIQDESSRPVVPCIVQTDPVCPVHTMTSPADHPYEMYTGGSRLDYSPQYHHSKAGPSLPPFSQLLEISSEQTVSMNDKSQRIVHESSISIPNQEDLSKRNSNDESVCRKPSSDTSSLLASSTEPEVKDYCQNTHDQSDVYYSEEDFEGENRSYASSISIQNWTEKTTTARATPTSTLLSEMTSTIAPDSPVVSTRENLEKAVNLPCRELLLELLDIIGTGDGNSHDGDNEQDYDERCQSVDSSTSAGEDKPDDSSNTIKARGSGTHSTTSQTASEQLPGSKRPSVPVRDSTEADDKEDEPPSKKANREPERSTEQDESSSKHKLLIPCPILCPQKCHGTNTSISGLIRDLGYTHQVVICIECCKLLSYSGDGKNAEKFLKKHKTSNECTRKCICQSRRREAGTLHLPDVDCSPKRSQEMAHIMWRFIWQLVNPGQAAPLTQFCLGISCLHSNVLRPRTQRGQARTKSAKARGCEVLLNIADDRHAAEKQITVLESELKAAEERQRHDEILLQQCSQKISERDEIITFLLERLIKYGWEEMDPSFQKRLYRVSPLVFHTALDFQSKMKHRSAGPGTFVEVLDPTIPKPFSPQPDLAFKEIPQPTPSQMPLFLDTACHPFIDPASSEAGERHHLPSMLP